MGRKISFGAVPNLDKVVLMSGGKTPTYKGGPNFGAVVGVREKFRLEEILLCFGAAVHMSGPQDSAGKQPHTLAMQALKHGKTLFHLQRAEYVQFLRRAHGAAVVDCGCATGAAGNVWWQLGVQLGILQQRHNPY